MNTSEEWTKILFEHYGKNVDSVEQLSGWLDITVLVTDGTGQKFIFKIFADYFTTLAEQIEAEIAMVQFLADKGLPVPTIIPTKSGSLYGEISLHDGDIKRFSLQTYLAGDILARNEISPEVSRQIGDLAGRVDVVLSDFQNSFFKPHPNFLVQATEKLNVKQLVENFNDGYRQTALKCLAEFEKSVAGNSRLPMQQIHCDMHASNVIFQRSAGQTVKLCGLIDFSDSQNTHRVLEAAVVLVSLLAFTLQPIDCCEAFLAAYQKHVQLEKEERQVLKTIILSRIIQVTSIFQYKLPGVDSDKAQYLTGLIKTLFTVAERLLESASLEYKFFDKFASQNC